MKQNNRGSQKPEVMLRFVTAILVLCLTVLFSLTLTGCGSGGGGDTTPPSDPPASPTPPIIPIGPTITRDPIGIGAVMKSKIEGNASIGLGSVFNSTWKEIILPESSYRAPAANVFQGASMTKEFLKGSIAFIFLQWKPVSGATYYQVSYQGNPIWYSNGSHPGDPDYSKDNPQAYLDLDKELVGKIDTPGNYPFQINAFNGSGLVKQSAVSVSLGVYLDNYPTVNRNGRQFTWSAVPGASGYRLRAYNHDNGTQAVDSGLVTGLSYTLTGLTGDTYYDVIVDAQYLDNEGIPLEITRGISGLTY